MHTNVSETFSAWSRGQGYEFFEDADSLVIANAGGELRYRIASTGRALELTRSERAEDAVAVMTSPDVTDIERHLVTVFGYDLRASRRLPTIRFPFEWSSPAPGFAPVDLGDGWTTLSTVDGRILDAALRDADVVRPIIIFSYVADVAVPDLIASFEAPDGSPSLSAFVRAR